MPGITGVSLAFQVAATHEKGAASDTEAVRCSCCTAKQELSPRLSMQAQSVSRIFPSRQECER